MVTRHVSIPWKFGEQTKKQKSNLDVVSFLTQFLFCLLLHRPLLTWLASYLLLSIALVVSYFFYNTQSLAIAGNVPPTERIFLGLWYNNLLTNLLWFVPTI